MRYRPEVATAKHFSTVRISDSVVNRWFGSALSDVRGSGSLWRRLQPHLSSLIDSQYPINVYLRLVESHDPKV